VAAFVVGGGAGSTGPVGYSYAGLVVRMDGVPSGRSATRQEVLTALQEIRFSGWLAQPADGWLVAVAAGGTETVAADRRGVVGVGEWLAGQLAATVVAVRVVRDRQLLLVVWADGEEIGRYLSDPSYGLGPDDDTLPFPVGVEHAAGFAAACARPEVAEELAELLAEELDPDSVIESERLATAFGLLGLPRWLVAAASLPRDIPAGPRTRDLTRLRAGVTGPAGRIYGWAVEAVRRRRPPPPAVPDAPRGGGDIDPWLL
jgi:hypothetical protein